MTDRNYSDEIDWTGEELPSETSPREGEEEEFEITEIPEVHPPLTDEDFLDELPLEDPEPDPYALPKIREIPMKALPEEPPMSDEQSDNLQTLLTQAPGRDSADDVPEPVDGPDPFRKILKGAPGRDSADDVT